MICPKCSEPWDLDTIHDEVSTRFDKELWQTNNRHDQNKYEKYFNEVKTEFFTEGCSALGSRCNSSTKAHPFVSDLYDLMGDDVDGCEALLEDFGLC